VLNFLMEKLSMRNNWETARDYLIEHYFKDNEVMKKHAEKAYNGDVYSQKILAEWFEKNNYSDDARAWNDKFDTNSKELGIYEKE